MKSFRMVNRITTEGILKGGQEALAYPTSLQAKCKFLASW